jgi:hypothetical protein
LLEVTRLASITFWSLAFSWIRHTLVSFWGKSLLLCSSYLPLGVPNWTVKNHQHRTASRLFSGAIAGEKEDFYKGSFASTSFTLF